MMVAVASVGLMASSAMANVVHERVVSENPVDHTPHVLDGTVKTIAVVGSTAVVGGTFTQVREAAAGSTILPRRNLFAFDLQTGAVDPEFVPQPDTDVYALEAGPDGTVYVGGRFKSISGTSARKLVQLRISDGQLVASFNRARVNYGVVLDLERRAEHLYVGGDFANFTDSVTGETRQVLARLNANTGAIDPNFDIATSHSRNPERRPYVRNIAVSPADTKLIINGPFTQVDGQRRYQIAMIDIGATPSLSSWATHMYGNTCDPSFSTYLREMKFAPDGSYFVVVTTGGAGYGTTGLCTTAARWETDRTGINQEPTWVNYTGGDTLLSVEVTGVAVYVAGHQRWMDNPRGNNSEGPGAVPRKGIAAIHPTTGKSADIDWNPTRGNDGWGVEALVATPDGLLVGSDTEELGHEYHARLGMFPLQQ